ncbi:MAG: FHA domain-containing protein [Planctomycetota bacterium]|jgi:predicted component of type VI protein secretion system
MASVILSFGGKEIKSYELTKPATVVGRDPGVDIVIDNLGVSRSHCQLIKRGDGYVVQDMNSANGTYVNGTRVGEHGLAGGDQIVVGKYVLTYKAESAAPAAPAAPAGAPAGAKAVPAAGPVIPDARNAYMMDGNKIKERLEEMRRKELGDAQAPAADAPAAEPAPAAPAAPDAPAQESAAPRPERHTRIIMGSAVGGQGNVKRYLYLSWILIGVLILVLIVLVIFTLVNS